MDATQEAIIDFAAQRAREVWDDKQQPYLLALLSPELKARDVDYKALLGPLKLREFLQSEGSGKVKLVFHPVQRAKIGIIPHDKEFSYDASVGDTDSAGELARSSLGVARPINARFVVMNFLQLLATLPKEEVEKVVIPASVLATLVKVR